MKKLTTLSLVSLLAAVLILSVLFFTGQGQVAESRADGARLREEAKRLTAELARASERMDAMEEENEARQIELDRLEGELVLAKAELLKPAEKPVPVVPRTESVVAYQGGKKVGPVWLVPRDVVKNPETGEFTFDQVVVLDERINTVTIVTNVVEKEVIRPTTVNNNYLRSDRNYTTYGNRSLPYYYSGGGYYLGPSAPGRVEREPRPDPKPVPVLPSPTRPGGSPWGSAFVPPTRR